MEKMKESMRGELVRFVTPDNVMLHGFLVRQDSNRRDSVIINVPGLGGCFYRSNVNWELAERFAAAGRDFFAINTRGSSMADKVMWRKGRKWETRTGGMAFEKFEDCIFDIKGAVDWCWKRGYRRIVLQGHSTGCQKSTYYMAKTKDRRVSAIVLLAPADDLNIQKKELGKRFARSVAIARRLTRNKKQQLMPPGFYNMMISASRYLSVADEKRAEAQLFDYAAGEFRLFRTVKIPVLAIFGSDEEYRTMPVSRYLKMLEKASGSKSFGAVEIKGANHGFKGKEKELGKAVLDWLVRL